MSDYDNFHECNFFLVKILLYENRFVSAFFWLYESFRFKFRPHLEKFFEISIKNENASISYLL